MTLREFTQIMELLKRQYVNQQDADTGDAFVALGGNRDRTVCKASAVWWWVPPPPKKKQTFLHWMRTGNADNFLL